MVSVELTLYSPAQDSTTKAANTTSLAAISTIHRPAGPPDSERPTPHGSIRGYRSWSYSPPCAPAVPAASEYRIRLPVGTDDRSGMTESLRFAETAQAAWSRSVPVDSARPGYAATMGANLFLGGLRAATEAEFLAADGAELTDTARRPAKMRSLISSAALGVNFFDAWRDSSLAGLGQALGLRWDPTVLSSYGHRHRPKRAIGMDRNTQTIRRRRRHRPWRSPREAVARSF